MAIPSLVLMILMPPLLGFLVLSFFGRRLGRRFCAIAAVAAISVPFVAGVLATLQISQSVASVTVTGPEWISISNFRLPFEFLVDPLSMTMVLIITGVGALIHLYATAYMADDPDFSRFFTYMNLFVLAMLVLVLGNNLAMLFIGWEGVGLCSYLLIGFWYKDVANAKSANKAFIVNRIGDWGLLLGLGLIVAVLTTNGSVSDGRLLSYDAMAGPLLAALKANPALATTIGLLLFVGAAGKSAQFPLYLWLPDAMAGPTPVSALIHAATMVTSGVFLLNRMHYVFEMSPVASAVVCAVGAFTAAFAALIAFGQTDIKKVLAYSTVSQLGFMFIACGAGAYWAGMFHVATHAFFKALLFLGAGAVIYSMAHDQDMRNYGNLRKYLPITFVTMCVGWLAISGVPFLVSGFYSKEAILGSAINSRQATFGDIQIGPIAGWAGFAIAFLTAAYMTRLTYLTFFGKEERWRTIPANHGHDHHGLSPEHTPKEAPASMTGVLVVLAILSLGAGLLNYNGAFERWLSPSAPIVIPPISHEVGSLPVPLWIISAIAALGGIGFGIIAYRAGLPKDQGFQESSWQWWRRLELRQFGVDHALSTGAVEGGNDIGKGLDRWFERGFIDRIVNGVGYVSTRTGSALKTFQTGYVRLYALVMLCGAVAFLGYFLWAIRQLGGN
jgi:NADH-quinone oxidoreductase subunit L